MSPRVRILSPVWLSALVGAGGFWLWLTVVRVQRVDYVTNLVATDAVADPTSPTGYAHGWRQLIVPEHNNDSCQWIAQTQQMFARHEWRVRHVDYDNAPFGREVLSPSPYRWWLGLVSWAEHLVAGQPLGLAVGRAALIADPVWQLLLLVGTAFFVARRFGPPTAAIVSVGLVTLYPFGGTFLPGQPNDGGLVLACVMWSVLLLLAGVGLPDVGGAGDAARDEARRRRCFAVAGGVGGLGLWVHPATEVPVLAGIALGGVCAAVLAHGTAGAKPLPWRIWALSGAATSLAAYLVEYFPGHLGGLHLAEVNPLYGLAWLGAGEWLTRLTGWMTAGRPSSLRRTFVMLFLAAAPVAALAVVALRPGDRELVAAETMSTQLTNLAGSPMAPNLWAWIRHDSGSLALAAACLPVVVLLVAAGWLLLGRRVPAEGRTAVCLALGPLLIALALGCAYLSWWNAVDAVLLALLAAVIPAMEAVWASRRRRLVGWGILAASLLPGLLLFADRARADGRRSVNEGDVEALIDRDLAQWLANTSGGHAVVLAPPNLTTSFYFHGGLAGLATLDLANRAGLRAAIRIAGASSPDEAQALARGRHLKYIVIPSWDDSLDEYARLGSNNYAHTLMALLHHWLPPRWLRPVPYHLPKVEGFEGQSVAIFEVVDVQDNATALSHLAEYFVEMGRIGDAVGVAYTLAHSFPTDLGATVARALVAQAADDPVAFQAALGDIRTFLTRGDDKSLPWDRRVSLAIALAEGKQFDLAREQVRQCLATVNEARLRSLTTVSLYRLEMMSRGFRLAVNDPGLQTLAQRLLPAELRGGK